MTITILNRWTATTLWTGEAETLRAGVEHANLRGTDLGDANLRGANLRGADLGDANLRGADLGDANLRGANLRGADLRGANLGDANLRGANLRGADLGDANLRGADLGDADLRGADLGDADLGDANLTPIRDDVWAVLSSAPHEAPAVLAALREGRVDGSTYSGDCACLVGTIANARGCNVDTLERNSGRPAEKFFMGIHPGDTPATNQVSKIAAEWVDEWVTRMRAAFGASA